jgi:hypothetical protein
MRKLFLGITFFASAIGAVAQTTYNYFDPADCDEYGWVWFDTAEKLAKYCGTSSDSKVRLVAAERTDSTGAHPMPVLDATAVGWNLEGVRGGEGAHTGAIILPETDFSITWLTDVNGGGILMQFPDLAKLDLFVSLKGDAGWADEERTIPGNCKDMYGALYGGEGYLEPESCSCIDIWYSKYAYGKVLSDTPMYYWKDIDTYQAWNYDWDDDRYYPIWLGNKGEGRPVTAYIINNNKTPWYIHGIRAYTYTNTNASVDDIEVAPLDVKVKGRTICAGDNTRITVYTMSGTLICEGRGNTDCSSLAGGVYVVKAVGQHQTRTIKVVF